MRRNFLSVVLCVCMMLTMAPFAFAAGTDTGSNTEGAGTSTPANSSSGAGGGSVSTSTTNAITNETNLRTALESANDGDTITISGTISIDAPLVITKTVTLTGGSIIASDSFNANSNELAVANLVSLKTADKTLTLKDITLNGNGKALVVYSNAGKVVVDGATITGGKTNSSVAGVYMTNASEFEMTSGSISSNEVGKTDYSKYAADLWVGANAKATLSGGKIDNIFVNANSFSENNPGYFKMQDGHVTNLYAEYYENYGATVIYDGGTLDNLYISTTASNGACENVTPVAGMTYKGGQTDEAALTPVAEIDAKKFTSLADAIATATADNKTVILLKDVTEDVVIPSDKTVTLNLNGKKLTNVSSDTITVANGANLTITGEGTVDNVTHGKADIYNNGTVILNGGNYTRSHEAKNTTETSGGNSYYNILNHGDMTIDGAVKVLSTGHFSSLVANGYYNYGSTNPRDGYVNGTNQASPKLTINNGSFSGGINTIKNDDNATLEIKAGTFTNYTQSAFQNHHIATIEGGTFDGANVWAVLNCGAANCPVSDTDKHETTITGGYFNGNFEKTAGSITISGGYFTTDPTPYCGKDDDGNQFTGIPSTEPGYAFTVGRASTEVKPATAAPAVDDTKISEKDKATAKEVSESVTDPNNVLSAAANIAATEISKAQIDSAKSQLTDELKLTNSPEIYTYAQAYLKVTPTAVIKDEAGNTITSITMDIQPMYRVVASTKENANEIVIEPTSGKSKNAVVLNGSDTKLANIQTMEISLELPSTFTVNTNNNNQVYVQHKGHEYIATVTTGENSKKIATFTNPDGFSEFTISKDPAAVATIGQNRYTTLQAAVDAVQNGQTIKLEKDCAENVTVSRAVKFTLNKDGNGFTGSISAGSRYSVTSAVDSNDSNKTTYTVTYVGGSSSSGSTSTTYNVNVNAATNGAVAADKKTAAKGTTVTVTASPSKGYVVDAVKVVDKDGKDVAVTEKDGKYVFTMPASAVTVTGSFKAETPAPVALPFTDVKSGNWFYDAVKYAYEQGLMTGTSATTFAPNGTMNRAMIVTVLYRLEKSPAVTGASKFTDVPAGQWYSDAVAWAAANKIVNGYDETTFGPMNAVTREQMAAILFRYEQVKGLENVTLEENLNRFPDQNKISAYAIPALQWAVGQKIINGNADGTLDPTGTATRAQVAQIFTNLLNQ